MDLLSKRLLVVSGKGGVGKTVISSALGLIASRRGKRVLLVKMDDQGRTAQLFGTAPLTDEVRPLREGVAAINLDPKTVAADYIQRQVRVRRLARHIVDSQLFESWFRVSPAIKEMVCLGKVWSLVEERSWWSKAPTWDLVIFDAPATGHGLGLLRLPEQASKLLIGPMRKSALAVDALLSDHTQTSLLITTIPEEMPVNEAIHFYEEARANTRIHLAGVVLNAAFPRRFEGTPAQAELEATARSAPASAALQAVGVTAGGPEALLAAARYTLDRADLTERYEAQLRETIDLPLWRVPYLFAERFGLRELDAVADHLVRTVPELGSRGSA